MNLYEIDQAISAMIENSVDPETGELVLNEDALNDLQMERDAKVENLALYIKNLKAEAIAIKAEEDALAKRRQSAEKKAARLTEYLKDALDGEKFSTAKVAVTFRSSQSVELEKDFLLWATKTNNDNLLRYKDPEPNKVAIKALLAEGGYVPYAKLVTTTSMTVK